jgi:hypothetical protein
MVEFRRSQEHLDSDLTEAHRQMPRHLLVVAVVVLVVLALTVAVVPLATEEVAEHHLYQVSLLHMPAAALVVAVAHQEHRAVLEEVGAAGTAAIEVSMELLTAKLAELT